MKGGTMVCFRLSIGFQAGHEETIPLAEFGMTEEEWAAKSPEEQNGLLNEWWRDWSSNYIDGAAYIEGQDAA